MTRALSFLVVILIALVAVLPISRSVGAQKVPVTLATLTDPAGTPVTYATDYVTNVPAVADPSGPTLLAERDNELTDVAEIEGDWTNVRTNQRGALWVAVDQAEANTLQSVTDLSDGVEHLAVAAGGAGIRNYITDLECTNTSATDVIVTVANGAGGTVIWRLSCPAGGGNNRAFNKPLRGATNLAVFLDASAAAASVHVSLNAYTRP
jgi:hypothetical protein